MGSEDHKHLCRTGTYIGYIIFLVDVDMMQNCGWDMDPKFQDPHISVASGQVTEFEKYATSLLWNLWRKLMLFLSA